MVKKITKTKEKVNSSAPAFYPLAAPARKPPANALRTIINTIRSEAIVGKFIRASSFCHLRGRLRNQWV
jgi:hypothetical protein